MNAPGLNALLCTALGVGIAVVLPVLTAMIRKDFPRPIAPGIPPWAWRYMRLFVFSLLVAFICLAWWTSTHPGKDLEWQTAFLLGFAWEAALEKAMQPPAQATAAPARPSLALTAAAAIAALAILAWAATPA